MSKSQHCSAQLYLNRYMHRFPGLTHSSTIILYILVKAGYQQLYINIIKDIYSGYTYQVKNSLALRSTIGKQRNYTGLSIEHASVQTGYQEMASMARTKLSS